MLIGDYINALPDVFRKDSNSNNYKLLKLEEQLVAGLRDDIKALEDVLDINKATGATLDLYGETYDQARGKMTDEQYRYIILQAIAKNMVNGDYNSIVNALAVAFGTTPDQVVFEETENPAEIEIESMPYTILLNAGISASQLMQIILAVLPVGVSLSSGLNLEGTFEFGTTEGEYDADKGFGDIAQTLGGYLGLLVTDDVDIPT